MWLQREIKDTAPGSAARRGEVNLSAAIHEFGDQIQPPVGQVLSHPDAQGATARIQDIGAMAGPVHEAILRSDQFLLPFANTHFSTVALALPCGMRILEDGVCPARDSVAMVEPIAGLVPTAEIASGDRPPSVCA